MTISQAFREAMYAQQTERALLALVKIEHADLADPIRVVNDGKQLFDGTNYWLPFPFELILPTLDEATVPKAKLRICNVDRQITIAIRSLTSQPTVTVMIVMDDYYYTQAVEYGPFAFKLGNVTYNTFTVEGVLTFDEIFEEPYPGDYFSPGFAPGLF